MTRIIAVASGKGGTGKTTTAVNLAVALNDMGRNVILCDANFNTPHVCLHLGVETPEVCINHLLFEKRDIMKAIYFHPSGIKFIPNNGYSALDANIDRFPELMLELVGKCEIVIMDAGHAFSKDKVLALKSADETIIVTNPDLPALIEAKKVIRASEGWGSSVIGVVLNRVSNRYSLPLKDISRYMNKTLLGVVPEDLSVRQSLFLQHPVIYTAPSCPAAKEFRKIAELLNI